MSRGSATGIRTKLIVVLTLAIVCVALAFLVGELPVSSAEHAADVRDEVADVNAVLDSLFARYHIERKAVKTWHVQTPDKKFIRVERRVIVPPDFISLRFNHDLSRELERFGARAVATERTKENAVTMHIKRDGIIIQSITFLVKRSL